MNIESSFLRNLSLVLRVHHKINRHLILRLEVPKRVGCAGEPFRYLIQASENVENQNYFGDLFILHYLSKVIK